MNQVEHAGAEAREVTRELWDAAPSAAPLLEMLGDSETYAGARVGSLDRQLRLFAAWCARRTGRLLEDPRSRSAVQAAELFAAGSMPLAEIERAHDEAGQAVREAAGKYEPGLGALTRIPSGAGEINRDTARAVAVLNAAYTASHAAAHTAGTSGGLRAATKCAETALNSLYWQMLADGACAELITEKLEEEDRRQAEALRTFIGNPFDAEAAPAMCVHSHAARPDRRRPFHLRPTAAGLTTTAA